MPRSKQYIKIPPLDTDRIENAITLLKKKKLTLHGASQHFTLPRSSLRRYYSYVMKEGTAVADIRKNLRVKKVFDDVQERILVNYIKEAAILQFGLTLKNVRKLAYQFAKANQIKYPSTWDYDKMAGEYWLRLFRKRFKDEISLRKPEATSLARLSAFNKHTVALTFNNYKKALSQCPSDLQATDIWNIDETGLSTVHVPPKILAPTGIKQVGSVTSAERGNTVTMIAACNAGGGFIPPMLIFPRVNFKDFMLYGAPEGSLGAANPSGWSNETTFVMFMNHFIKFARPTKERPAIVLIDNHESHISIPTIRLAKENGVILVTLHPHTSNKMQPLDKSVFGPFKTFFNLAANEKMITQGNIGKPLTIYDIAGLVGKAFPSAFTPTNISNGFKATGFHPLNENIFSEADFVATNFIDRPIPPETALQFVHVSPKRSSAQAKQYQIAPAQFDHLLPQECSAFDDLLTQERITQAEEQFNRPQHPEANTEINHQPPKLSSQAAVRMITPEMIRPYPKPAPLQVTQKGRQKGKSRILTDTPEKNEIELLKSNKKVALKKNTNLKKDKNKEKKKVDTVKKKLLVEYDSEESIYSIHDTDDSYENKISACAIDKENIEYILGDFVIFIYKDEYFVGQVDSLNEEGVLIKSMQKSLKNWIWPDKDDLNWYPYQDIKQKVNTPKKVNSKRELYYVPEMAKYWDFI